tara:strand:- start:25438 stop:26190 length:753 start_codon:yes stop_codon:yes gene_type:complete
MNIRNIIETTIQEKYINIGHLPINIILSYLSEFKEVKYSEIPEIWKYISLFGTGRDYKFYKLIIYEYNIILWFGSYNDLIIENKDSYKAFEFAIQSSVFRYLKYYRRTILNGYRDNAAGLQEYINNELGIFINYTYINHLYKFITKNLSKFCTITSYFSYLRNNKYFCQKCKELFEESQRCECEIENSDSEYSDSDSDSDSDSSVSSNTESSSSDYVEDNENILSNTESSSSDYVEDNENNVNNIVSNID